MKQTRISREDWGALRMILCASGYAVYSQSTENKINESSCVTVHRSNAVITVDKDLLEKAQCEMFGKNSISNGSLLFHQESAAKNGTPILVPFTFNRRGQSAFQAVVRCSE
ncbi:hypothetical protein [Pantoea sp. SM3]|uniref:hypothetical protein n=1 Tax=Pantoea sp. SM3 TaxID=1628192 RepID=UPI000AFECAF0|nr:hypothetical protein [Pantoea sp. SM3]